MRASPHPSGELATGTYPKLELGRGAPGMAAVGRVALALLALGHTEMAISSALCDSAMGQFCSDKRGTGGACTSCLGTFTHQSLLHVAGCTSAELTAYCRPGLQRPQRLVVYHVYPAPEKGQHSWQDTSIANKNTADLPGMIYFELRALGLPVECLEQSIVVPIPGSKPLITPDPVPAPATCPPAPAACPTHRPQPPAPPTGPSHLPPGLMPHADSAAAAPSHPSAWTVWCPC